MKKIIIILAILLIAITCSIFIIYMDYTKENNSNNVINNILNDNLVETNNDELIEETNEFIWEIDDPENHNLSAEILRALNESFVDTEITSSIIVKDGKIINEYYKDGYDENSIFPIHSCSKSITSAVFGIAKDQGRFDNLDELISNYFPQINEMESNYKKEITIRHLLTHTSGIKSTEDDWYTWRASSNWIDYVLNSNMEYKPGTTFDYSTGNTHLLSAIIQSRVRKTLYEYGKENLFDLIGMESIRCQEDDQGISDGGNGFTLTARDMARFGLLYVNNGEWEGRKIISEDWIEESTSTQFERSSGTADYGYQWWTRTFGKNKYNSYFAQGHGGQFIFIIPDLDMVITFTSNYYDNSHSSDYWSYVNTIVNNEL